MTKNEIATQTLDFLKNIYERRGIYHDHKEKMAWTVSSIYFTFSLTVIAWLLINKEKIQPIDLKIKIILTIFFLIILICSFIFVLMQLKMRWYAADETVTIKRFIFIILASNSMPFSEFNNKKLNFKEDDFLSYYPIEMQQSYENLKKRRNKFIKNLFCDKEFRKDNRLKTEIPTYFMMISVFIIKILILFIYI